LASGQSSAQLVRIAKVMRDAWYLPHILHQLWRSTLLTNTALSEKTLSHTCFNCIFIHLSLKMSATLQGLTAKCRQFQEFLLENDLGKELALPQIAALGDTS
jgi:hypothetical protein